MSAQARAVASSLVVLGALAPGSEDASAARVEPGVRTRITLLEGVRADTTRGLAPGARLDGRLLWVRPDTIALADRDGNHTRLVPRETVASFEISTWRRSRAGRGAWIGLLAGAAGGVAFGLHVKATENTGENDYEDAAPAVLGVAGGIVGLGLGALVGSMFHTDLWMRPDLPRDVPPR